MEGGENKLFSQVWLHLPGFEAFFDIHIIIIIPNILRTF